MSAGLFAALRGLLADYRKTLKAPEIEERLDVWVFRPMAFLLVRLLTPTSITPNQITLLSIVVGVAAGWAIGLGTPASMAWGAFGVLLYNVLDCADGMLARVRKLRSPLGYVLDGLAGYVGTAAIILGLGAAVVQRAGQHPLFWWTFTVIAGISMAWWCAVVDGMRLDWMRRVHGQCQDRAAELAALKDEAEQWRRAGTHRWERGLVTCYVIYVQLWEGRTLRERVAPPGEALPVDVWAAGHRPTMRLAIWAGPTLQLTAMGLAALFGRPEWLLWAALVAGNAWGIGILVARWAVRQRLLAGSFEGA